MRWLVYILLILTLSACRYSISDIDRELDRAEDLLEKQPQEALASLNALELDQFSDSATMARWALLYSEALDANRLTSPSDTIINIAIDYYGNHNPTDLLNIALSLKDRMGDARQTDALATALYLKKEKEFMLYRERTRRELWLMTGIFLLLAACGIIVWQRQRLRLKESENVALLSEATLLRDDLLRHRTECDSLASRLDESLSNRFDIIDNLCETYYESQGLKNEQKAIIDKVKTQINALKADEGVFAEMERCHRDTLMKFKAEMPQLKKDDYRLMVYLCCGLSSRTIAFLIGESIDVAYKRKSRLKARIASAFTPNSELFLSKFR